MQLYYEDIKEGSNLLSKSWGPLTNMDMIRFGSAVDSYGEIHQDYDWCIQHGFDNVLLSGPFKQALLCSWLDEVVGDIGYISLAFQKTPTAFCLRFFRSPDRG